MRQPHWKAASGMECTPFLRSHSVRVGHQKGPGGRRTPPSLRIMSLDRDLGRGLPSFPVNAGSDGRRFSLSGHKIEDSDCGPMRGSSQ